MTLTEFFQIITQVTFLAVAALSLVELRAYRDKLRRDNALVFGVLGIIVIMQLLERIFDFQIPSLATSSLLITVPYLLLRSLSHFRTVTLPIQWASLLGTALSILLLLIFSPDLPLASIVVIILIFVSILLYVTVSFLLAGDQASGLAVYQLRLIAAGTGFMAGIFLIAGIMIFVPALGTALGPVTSLLGALSALAYYLGLNTPAWLRKRWGQSVLATLQSGQWSLPLQQRWSENIEEFLAAIVQSTDNAIIGKTLDGVIMTWNRGAERTYGYSAEEMIGQPVSLIVAPDKREELDLNLQSLKRGERIDRLETQRVTKDGEIIDVSLMMSPVRDRHGKLLGSSTVAHNITELKATTRELKQSQARLRSIIDSVPLPLAITRVSDDILLYGNPAYGTFVGKAVEDLVGQKNPDLYADPAERARAVEKIALEGGLDSYDLKLKSLIDGREFWASATARPITFEGEPAFIGAFLDITERKQAEEQIRESEARQQLILNSMLEGCQIIDQDWRYRYVNDPLTEQGRLATDELIGRTMMEAYPGIEKSEMFGRLKRCMEERIPQRMENEFSYPDGSTRWFDLSIQPFQQGIVIFSLDITQQREAVNRIREINQTLEGRVRLRTAELETANKDLESFSYSVSHDLRAPLRALSGFSRILVGDYGDQFPDEAAEYLARIQQNAERMGTLIDDLLAFSRLGRSELNRQEVDLKRLAQEVLTEIGPLMEGRTIQVEIMDIPPCQADPAMMRQVLANLLENAVKYTRPREEARITLGCNIEPDQPVYYIIDNGVGFDMQYADQLFGVFQRIHRADEFEGTGVGLAVVHKIIQRHGGRVWAESVPDQGTTFYFTTGESRVIASK